MEHRRRRRRRFRRAGAAAVAVAGATALAVGLARPGTASPGTGGARDAAAAAAARPMENLGRGVVAVRSGESDVLVSWRLLGLDPENIGFNVCRAAGGGDWSQINDDVVTDRTNFVDSGAVSSPWTPMPPTNAVHRLAMADRLRTRIAAADWAAHAGVPLVFGEGWIGYTPLHGTFEERPVGAAFCRPARAESARAGVWGSVVCSNAAPHHPMWRDVTLQRDCTALLHAHPGHAERSAG